MGRRTRQMTSAAEVRIGWSGARVLPGALGGRKGCSVGALEKPLGRNA